MRIGARIHTAAKAAGLLVAISAAACTHASANLMVDAPKLLPYQPPDIDELTGIDSSDDAAPAAAVPAAGSAQNPQQAPHH
jgi:hypothetical protein